MLFCLVFCVGVVLSPRSGVSWDEPDNIFAGGIFVTFFKEGFRPHAFDGFWQQRSYFRDRIFTLDPTLSHYPPLANYVGSLFTLVSEQFGYGKSGPQIIVLFHVATALFFALLVAHVYNIAILMELTPITALFVALATYLYPTMFGHGLTNLKDTAQAAMFTWAMYFLVRGSLVRGAVVWGLALATKFNAVYVPIIWGIWKIRSIRGIKKLLVILVVGFATAFLVWPYLWFNTIAHVGEVVTYFTTVGQGYHVYWYGHLYTVGERSTLWWYPWMSILTMTPPILLLLGGIGAMKLLREKDKKRKLLLLWFFVPMARTILPYAAFYDGLRHFMEVIPAMMLLCGVGVEAISRRLYPVILGGIVGYLILINVSYFPYSTGYVNMFVSNPNINLDRDIEGLSVKEGIDWLHQAYGDVSVWIPISSHTGWVYVRGGRDQIVRDVSGASFIIVVNKASHLRVTDYISTLVSGCTLVHEIRRGTAVFGWVYKKN